jgi:uncharacterized protein YbaP (TraB family)
MMNFQACVVRGVALLAAIVPMVPARAEPALWRADSATAHVYLFGTMHILPKKADWFGPKISAAFNASSTLWEEADIGTNNPQLAAKIMTQALAPDFDLWAAIPAPTATKFRGELHGCGIDPGFMTHMKPWMASMMVTICQIMAASKGGLGASGDNPEAALLARAQGAGKSVAYFETAEQQIGYISGAPQSAQLTQLKQAIDEAETGHDDYGKLESAWLAADVSKIADSVVDTRKQDEAFYQTIFVQRNQRFAKRIAEMLHDHGTVFVAIGAGHFAGNDSVLRMLADQGIKVARQ